MASVFVGRHKIGRREAIKILHPELAASEEIRARFEQEARAVNVLRHPGAVQVLDVDTTDDGAPFLVMELLDGESLAARAQRGPPLTVMEIVRIGAETLDVLAAAHAVGIVHRDIKPENLFLTRSGAIKVLDFGIARVRAAGARGMATQHGLMLGTMAYMPPEQARGLEIDARADLYAVGATLYELLSGKLVHEAEAESDAVLKAMSEPAPPLRSVASHVPAPICDVVDRALAFDRAHRYPDAAAMKTDLEAAARGDAPPYLASAAPLPNDAPSSAVFALRDSFFGAPVSAGADPSAAPVASSASVVSPASGRAAEPSVVASVAAGGPSKATRVERPADPAPTRHVAIPIPTAAVPSARVSALEPPAPPPPARPPTPRTAWTVPLVLAGMALVAVLVLGVILGLLVSSRSDSRPADDDRGQRAAEPTADEDEHEDEQEAAREREKAAEKQREKERKKERGRGRGRK